MDAPAPKTMDDTVMELPVIGAEVSDVRIKSRDESVAGARSADEARAAARGQGESHIEFCVTSRLVDGTETQAWRTPEEFPILHEALIAAGCEKALRAVGVESPLVGSRRSAMSMAAAVGGAAAAAAGFGGRRSAAAAAAGLWPAKEDDMELRRAAADHYIRGVLACPEARDSDEFRSFLRPKLRPDWPSSLGPIDLAVHDGPHFSSHTEWWYYNMHFETAEGHRYSAFVAFFRALKKTDVASGDREWGFAINWALSDVSNESYTQECVLDKSAPGILKSMIEKGKVFQDPRLQRAYLEVLDKNEVPLPDRCFVKDPVCKWGNLDLETEVAGVKRTSDGRYRVWAKTVDGKTTIDFVLTPRKPPVRHGKDGVVKGHDGDDMFYYLIPRCDLEGTFRVNGEDHKVASGQGWYDHEFGGHRDDTSGESPMQYAWNWAAIQLDNGYELSVATLVDPRTTPYTEMERRAIVIDPKGKRVQPDDLSFRAAFVGGKHGHGSVGASSMATTPLGGAGGAGGGGGGGGASSSSSSTSATASKSIKGAAEEEAEADAAMAAEDEWVRERARVAREEARKEVRDSLRRAGDTNVAPESKTDDKASEGPRTTRTEPLPTGPWRSVRTFSEFPTRWSIQMPSQGIDLTLTATFDDQEFVTIIAKPSFWEGRVDIEGHMHGKPVSGVGYIEVNGFNTLNKLTQFFKRVGEETRIRVQMVYPDNPTYEDGVRLIGDDDHAFFVDGVDMEIIDRNLLKPVRHICDQGGKSWRSYGALACIEMVGGDSRPYRDWLAMPEFMHAGSLIIDDFQDKSLTRRGVPCVHLLYGEDVAINAGTAAYFQGQKMLALPSLSDRAMVDIYDAWFRALRSGHAGQALDMAGLEYLMDSAIEAQSRGDSAHGVDLLKSRIFAVHRLKTAAPAASLAEIGAYCGLDQQPEMPADRKKAIRTSLSNFFLAVGLSFQIADDYLNLRGLVTSEADRKKGIMLKTIGEDITAGKATVPVILAVERLPADRMRQLWSRIKAKPEDPQEVGSIIAELEDCGAIEASISLAKKLVDDAWKELDPVIPDSFSKIMIRSFGWFVTERHT